LAGNYPRSSIETVTAASPVVPALVSVIVPIYRAERFLRETIESVRAQSHDAWELLLVDDGGGDGSAAIASEYAERDPQRVTLLSHPGGENRGASASRNLAIRHARGAYIALLDADDVWLPAKLRDQVALLEAHPDVGMLYGNSLYWYGWTNVPADRARDRVPDLGFAEDTVVEPPRLLECCLRGTVAVPCPCSVILRRAAVERSGGFNEQFTGANASSEDLVFFAKVMLRERVLVANRIWDRYRRHEDSVYERAKADGIAASARYHYLEWLRDFIAANSFADDELRRTVAWAMARASEPSPPRGGGRLRRFASHVADRLRRQRDDAE
jgi:glycosyltransferase involved in cell wall biosynthesis